METVKPYRQVLATEDLHLAAALLARWRAMLAGRAEARRELHEGLAKLIEEKGYTQAAISRALGMSRQQLSKLLLEERSSPAESDQTSRETQTST